MVDLQSTNRVKISKVRESTFGTTPTSPAFKTRRVTSHGLATNPKTVVSNEIRSDRQVSDLILVGIEAGGPSAGEMSFRTMDEDLEEALQGTWSLTPERDNNGTADSVITDVATTNTVVTCTTGAAFVAGQLVLFSGFGVAGNNGVFKCTTGSATVPRFVGSGITNETAPPAAAKMKVVGFQGAAGDLVATVTSGNGITSTLLDFTTLGLAVGQWVRVAGFDTTANNGFCRISAIAAARLSFDRVPASWAADAAVGDTISVYVGDVLTNASTKRSNTFERQYLDHAAPSYEYLTGQTLDKLSISIQAGAVVTYTEDWIGANGSISSTRASGATDTAAPTNDVLNAASNVGQISFDGAAIDTPNYVMSATIDFANNLRRQIAVGHLPAVGIGNGEFTVTGTLNSYFGSKAVLDELLANNLVSFDCVLGRTDTNNESYLFDLPSIKLSAGAPSVSGKNADVMLPATYQALADATLGYTALVERFWYLP
jgi:hypothetical protein